MYFYKCLYTYFKILQIVLPERKPLLFTYHPANNNTKNYLYIHVCIQGYTEV